MYSELVAYRIILKRIKFTIFAMCEFYYRQCRINYGSGGSPEPGPLNFGGLIISQAEGADKKDLNETILN